MKEIDIPWPKKGDKLFEEGGKDWWNNAYVGGTWFVYADGYKIAGDKLVEYIDENDGYQDFIVYPTAFLYRHAIELKLKDVIENGRRLINTNIDLRTNHNLISLWKDCRDILETIWPKGSKDDLDATEEMIKQFALKDPHSMVFRYPFDKKGKRTMPDSEQFNLRILKDRISGVYELLDGASTGIGVYLENKREMEDYRREEQY